MASPYPEWTEKDRLGVLERLRPDATPDELAAMRAEWTTAGLEMALEFGF